MSPSIRKLHRRDDLSAIEAIDTSFETDVIFGLVASQRGIALEERRHGWVAEIDGAIRGFATVEYEPWHQRLVLQRGWS